MISNLLIMIRKEENCKEKRCLVQIRLLFNEIGVIEIVGLFDLIYSCVIWVCNFVPEF